MPRIAALGAVHHVISRFVDRSWQLAGEDERDAYLVRLGYALARTDWVLLGYALMSSHVHLVLEAGSGSLGAWAKSVHSRMARWLNGRHGRLGPVFADRPYAEVVEDCRVAHVLAYVHNNPVRARLVGWAGDCTWTSHRAYLGLEPARASLSVARGLERSGFGADGKGLLAFDGWVCASVADAPERATPLIRPARESARRHGGAHAEVGTPCRGADGISFPVVVPQGTNWHPRRLSITASDVITVVSDVTGVDARGRSSRDRRPAVTHARRVALAAWLRTDQTRAQMARALGIAASSASDLVNRQPGRVASTLIDEVMAELEVRHGEQRGEIPK